jgi:hypothetical protein
MALSIFGIFTMTNIHDTLYEQAMSIAKETAAKELRERIIAMLAPIAAASGATTVENIINTAAKLEYYITTGVNLMQPPVEGYNFVDGPITSDVFEIDADDNSISVDSDGNLVYV